MARIFGGAELDAIGLGHKTDKSSLKHDYLRFYEFYFAPFRQQQFVLLELGVGPEHNKGKSLMTFRDYFPRAQIVGVDIRLDAKEVETQRIHVDIGDCGSRAFLRSLGVEYRPQIIVDDASHLWSHQILSLETLFSALLPGGVFVVEDIHTSFDPLAAEYGDFVVDTASYLCELACLVGGGRRRHSSHATRPPSPQMIALSTEVDCIAFYKHSALLVKKA